MDWFRSLGVFCRVRRPPDEVLPLELGAPDEHAVPNPEPRRPVTVRSPLRRHNPMLPLLAKCLMKWRRGMLFLELHH
jgi:hypothetical protein